MKEISLLQINENPFRLIGSDWMLITAGNLKSFNTMTASWGGMGVLWNKQVVFIFIRPQRYTYGFAEDSDGFTLCFFDESYRDILQYCGSHSGRDVNKPEKTGLIPRETPSGRVYFEQARLVMDCRKLYAGNIRPENFLDRELERKIYPGNDHHRFYVGEITWCMQK